MKKSPDYDEKQLLDRGKAYQYGFIAALGLMWTIYCVVDIFELQISTRLIFNICFWIPAVLFFLTAIIKNAYDGVHSSPGMLFFSLFGALGVLNLLSAMQALRRITPERFSIEVVSDIFVGIAFIVVSVVYWLKHLSDKKKYADE